MKKFHDFFSRTGDHTCTFLVIPEAVGALFKISTGCSNPSLVTTRDTLPGRRTCVSR